MSDLYKLLILLPLYFVVAPLLGLMIRPSRLCQKIVCFWMVFFTVWSYRLVAMSPGFTGPYFRGHTRGYECTSMEILAVILLFSGRGFGRQRGPLIPPGMWLWLFYCLVSLLSIFNSVDYNYTMMAVVKFTKVVVVYMAVFYFLRDDEDVHFLLKTFSFTLMMEAGVTIFQKYVQHEYQAHAWFEHQNSMAMYTYMLGLPLLSVVLGPINRNRTVIYLLGFIASGIAVECALSRGALACFAGGCVGVAFLNLWDRFTSRRFILIAFFAVLGLAAIAITAQTIVGRYQDKFNQESNEGRHRLNQCSRLMIRDFPILGTGWNTYGVLINPPYEYGNPLEDKGAQTHANWKKDKSRSISESWYYLMLAETGFAGTGAMFLFFLTHLFWNLRSIISFRGTFRATIAIGLFMGIGMNYVQSNLERVLTQPKNLTAWMICLAIGARLEWWRRQKLKERALKNIPHSSPHVENQALHPGFVSAH